MTVETRDILNEETTTALQELIEINIDSYNGFKQAAAPLPCLLNELADQRLGQAVALQKLVIRNDENPITKGSITGRIRRAILDWRGAFGGSPTSMLKQAERGEDYIKAKYEAVLTKTAGSAVTDVLNHQYASVKEAHDRIRDLRDTLAAA
jgi:uncharacterized protein (TIGR02284 family)